MKERCLYDVYDVVREMREELSALQDADYKFDRIIQAYMQWHNLNHPMHMLEEYYSHGSFEGQTTDDGQLLHDEVFALYREFDRIIDRPDEDIATIFLDETTGNLLIGFA